MIADNQLNARFTAAMDSGDPARVAGALDELRDLVPALRPIRPPRPDVLDAFPDGAPGTVVRDYLWVLEHCGPFTPPADPAEIVRWSVEAVVRHPDGAAALQVVMSLRHPGRPAGADVGDVIGYLAERGVRPGREAKGAEYLALYLLDHSQTYARAVEALPLWQDKPVLSGVLHQVAPYLRPADRARLGL